MELWIYIYIYNTIVQKSSFFFLEMYDTLWGNSSNIAVLKMPEKAFYVMLFL